MNVLQKMCGLAQYTLPSTRAHAMAGGAGGETNRVTSAVTYPLKDIYT